MISHSAIFYNITAEHSPLLKKILTQNHFRCIAVKPDDDIAKKIIESNSCVLIGDEHGLNRGIELCRKIRSELQEHAIPIFFLVSSKSEIDEITVLEIEADEYLPSNINPKIFLARLRSVYRRYEWNDKKKKDIITISNIQINKTNRTLFVKNKPYELPKKEFDILWILAKKNNEAVSRKILVTHAWDTNAFVSHRTVDVHICNLRNFIKQHDISFTIKSIKGIGYRLVENIQKM